MKGVAQRAGPASLALGLRVKSGLAIAVALGGSQSAPHAVLRRLVELSDPDDEKTRQPYHDGFYSEQKDAREIARRVNVVTRCATRSVALLIEDISRVGNRQAGDTRGVRAGLVVGSVIDPGKVNNPHIRAHASEGRLFRTVLEESLKALGIDCDVIVEKQLAVKAAAHLRRPAGDIARVLAGFGKTLGSPWRADEKAAATAAWLVLS